MMPSLPGDPLPRPRDPGPADGPIPEVFATTEMSMAAVSPLQVVVDVLDLLHHFDEDEAKTFEFLGKLHDMFRVP